MYRHVTQEVSALRRAPILFIILIIGTWYVCGWLYRERISILGEQVTLLEQRLTQRGNLPIDQKALIPLPSPISLGDAYNEFLVFNENNSGWKPVPKYKDAPIDWRHVPADMEIYAEIFIRCYLRKALLHGPEQIADLPVPVAESPGAVRIGHPERSHLVEYLAPNSVFNSLLRQRSSPHLRPDDRLVTIDRVLHHASLGVA